MSIDINSHIVNEQGDYLQQPLPSMPSSYGKPAYDSSDIQHVANSGYQQRPTHIPDCKLDSLQRSGLPISSDEQFSPTSGLSWSTGNYHFQSVQSQPIFNSNALQQHHQSPIFSRKFSNVSVSKPDQSQFCNNIATDFKSHVMSEQGAYMQQPSPSIPSPYGTPDFGDLQHFQRAGSQQGLVNIPGFNMDSFQRSGLSSSPVQQISIMSGLSVSAENRNVQNVCSVPPNQFGKQNDYSNVDQHMFSNQHQLTETSGGCPANQEYSTPSNEMGSLQMWKQNCRIQFTDDLLNLAPNRRIKPHLNYQQRVTIQNIHNQPIFTDLRALDTKISNHLESLAPLFITQQRQSKLPLQYQHLPQLKQSVKSQLFMHPQKSLHHQQFVQHQQTVQCQMPLQHQKVFPTLQPSQLAVPLQLQKPVRLHSPQQLITKLTPQQQLLQQQALQPHQPMLLQQPLQLHQPGQLEQCFGHAVQNMQSQHVPPLVLNSDSYLNARQPQEITTGNNLLTGKAHNLDPSYNESLQQSDGNTCLYFNGSDSNISYKFTAGTMENTFENGQQICITKSDPSRKCSESLIRIPAPEGQVLAGPLGIPDSVDKPLVRLVNSTAGLSHSETVVVHKDLSEVSKGNRLSYQKTSSSVSKFDSKCSPYSPNYHINMPLSSVNNSSVCLNSVGGSYRSIFLHDPSNPQCPQTLGSDRVAHLWGHCMNETRCLDLAAISNLSPESTVPSSFDQCDKNRLKSSNHWVSYENEMSELKADTTVNSNPVTTEQSKVNVHTNQANGVEPVQEKNNFRTASIADCQSVNQNMPTEGLSPSLTNVQNSTRKEKLNIVSKVQDCSISARHGQCLKTSGNLSLPVHNPNSVHHPNNKIIEVVPQAFNLTNSAAIVPPSNSAPNLPEVRLEAIAVLSAEIEGPFPKLSTDTEEALDPCLTMTTYSPSSGNSGMKPIPSTNAEPTICDLSGATIANKDQITLTSILDQVAGSMEEIPVTADISVNAHKPVTAAFNSAKAGELQVAVVNPMVILLSESVCIDQENEILKDDLHRECGYLEENKPKIIFDTLSITDLDGAALTYYLPLSKSTLSASKCEYNSSAGHIESKENAPVTGSSNCGSVKQSKTNLSLQLVEENIPDMENESFLQQHSLDFEHHRGPECQGLQSECGAANTLDDTDQVTEFHISNVCTLVEGSAFYDPQIAKIVDAIPSVKSVAYQIKEDGQESPGGKDDGHSFTNKNNHAICAPLMNDQIDLDTHLIKTIILINDDCSFTEYHEMMSLTNEQINKHGTYKTVTTECGNDISLNKDNYHEAHLPFSDDKTNEKNSLDYRSLTTTTTEQECKYPLSEEKNVHYYPCGGNEQSAIDGNSVSSPLFEGIEGCSVCETKSIGVCMPFMTNQKHKENYFASDTASAQDVNNQLSVRRKVERQSKEKCTKRWRSAMQGSTNTSLENCKNKGELLLLGDLDILPPDLSDTENEDPLNKIKITLLDTDQMHALFPETATQFAVVDNLKCSQSASTLEKEPTISETLPISESSNTGFPSFKGRETNSLFSDDDMPCSLLSSVLSTNHYTLSQENKKQGSLNSEDDECNEMGCYTRPSTCATNSSLRENIQFGSSKENIQLNKPSNDIARSIPEDKRRKRQIYFAHSDDVKSKKVHCQNNSAISGQKLVERDRFHLSNVETSGQVKTFYSKKPRTKSRDKHYKVNASLPDDSKPVLKFKDRMCLSDPTSKVIPIKKFNSPDAYKGFLTEGIFEDLSNQTAVNSKQQTIKHLVVKIDFLKLSKAADGTQNMKSTEVSSCVTNAIRKKIYNNTSTNGSEHSKKEMIKSMSKSLHSTEKKSNSTKFKTKVSVLEKPPEKQEVQKEKHFAAKRAFTAKVVISNSPQDQDSSITKMHNSKRGKAGFDQYKKRIVTIQEYRQRQKARLEKAEKETLKDDKLKQNKSDHKKKIPTRLKRKSRAQSHASCFGQDMLKCLKSSESIKTSLETCKPIAAYPGKYKPCDSLNEDNESEMGLQDKCVILANGLNSSEKGATDCQKASLSAKAPKESKKLYLNRFALKTTTPEKMFIAKLMVGSSPLKTANEKHFEQELKTKTPCPLSDTGKFRMRERELCQKVVQRCHSVEGSTVGSLLLCRASTSLAGIKSRNENVEEHLPFKKRKVDQS